VVVSSLIYCLSNLLLSGRMMNEWMKRVDFGHILHHIRAEERGWTARTNGSKVHEVGSQLPSRQVT
jgi:hypothetical protein